MIDGVHILKQQSNVSFNNDIVFGISLAVFIVLLLLSLGISIVSIVYKEWWILFIIMIITIGMGVLSFCLYSHAVRRYVEYVVTVDDSVRFNDFYNKYEIIKEDGEIYTIRDRLWDK